MWSMINRIVSIWHKKVLRSLYMVIHVSIWALPLENCSLLTCTCRTGYDCGQNNIQAHFHPRWRLLFIPCLWHPVGEIYQQATLSWKKKGNCVETANIEMTKMTRNSMISIKISKENSWLLRNVSTFFSFFTFFPKRSHFGAQNGKI